MKYQQQQKNKEIFNAELIYMYLFSAFLSNSDASAVPLVPLVVLLLLVWLEWLVWRFLSFTLFPSHSGM